ncbi:4'-phosphopantetheinyl transferase family protein [Streptomyces olivochromogenes]|uniref:4'-phosphopantetheinyl transferase family protein n=1 Tax=Streptomyces olivochromogenes TaxID=1963 RepID=UPI001F1592B2|nr:4'-phosphopantetheinyl transferase superfamily protein [Streptomyces olivochromogenes]MCF3129265.1 4'-phosphopantetheinyl transferase superfamily protein [Streptomyces olivochromogenes]
MTDRHLWLLPESAVDAFITRMGGWDLLTDGERARCERPLAPQVRRRRLAARLLARHALSARSGRPPDVWRFRTTAHGRPEPRPPHQGLRFNLTHTDGLIACVVTDGDRACGVDAERSPAAPDALTHLPRFFAEAERAELAGAADGERAALVAAYWVLKEAYLKALGTGLRRDLSTFAFTRPRGGTPRVRDPQGPADHWHFDLIRPTSRHVLAVATERSRPAGLDTTTLFG